MAHRFKNLDRHTPMLLPPDLREWVGEDDLVHFVIAAVERLPLSAFAVNHKGCGDEQFPPPMMLTLLGNRATACFVFNAQHPTPTAQRPTSKGKSCRPGCFSLSVGR